MLMMRNPQNTNPATPVNAEIEFESAFGELDSTVASASKELEGDCPEFNPTSPVSDWEKLADPDKDHEITEEDLNFMKDFEREMILYGLLENDDLLGEELEVAGDEQDMAHEESIERTIYDLVSPVAHNSILLPASSQSPSSRRMVSPLKEQHKQHKKSKKISGLVKDGP